MRKKTTKKNKVIDATSSLLPVTDIPEFRNRLKPKSENQKEYIRYIAENTITFCQGVAGSD